MPKKYKVDVCMHGSGRKLDLFLNTFADCVTEGEPGLHWSKGS